MSFGLTASGDFSNVQIDSESGVLNVLAEGQYTTYGTTSGEGYVINFPATIRTQEPPLMFLCPDMASVNGGRANLSLVRPVGSPGAWTGFRVSGVSTVTPHLGKYFAAALNRTASSERFGLRIWDEQSSMVFDSGHRLARLIGPAGKWTYKGGFTTPSGLLAQGWSCPWGFGDDAYFLASPFGTELIVSNSEYASINLEFATNKSEVLLWLTTLPGVWLGGDFWMPALGGRMDP